MANEFKIKKGLIVSGSGGTLLDVQGSVGQVFSVTDSLTGDIFSVSDVSGIPIFNVNSDGTVTIDGNIQLADNDKIQLGDDQDLELYHDGTHSYISDNGTGELKFIANGATRFRIGSDVASLSGTDFAIAAARKLYLDGQSNTYITESSSDVMQHHVGGNLILQLQNTLATIKGTLALYLTDSVPGNLDFRRNTNGDSQILGDIKWMTSHTNGTDDRATIIRGQTQGGGADTRGGIFKFYTRKSGSNDFNTTEYNKDGNWIFPGSITAGSITAGTSGSFQVNGAGYIQLGNCTIAKSGDSNHIHVNCPTALIPEGTTTSTNTMLGTDAYRWKQIYSGHLSAKMDSTFSNTEIQIPNTTDQNPRIMFYRPTGSAATSYPWRFQAGGGSSSSFYIGTGSSANNGSETISNKITISSTGTLTAAGDVIAYSDARLKENVKTLDGSKVLQMRGVSFDRKDTGISSSGVIAQEMQKIAPELVSNDDGTLGVAYGNLTGYLIEAIKEQQKQIDELKSQMAACNKKACNCNCKN